jgi:BA14K-like protein
MFICIRKLATAAVLAASVTSMASVASASPVINGLAIKNALTSDVETVQWRRGWRGGWHGGWGGVGAGFVAGAIIGSMITAPYYYGPGPYYGYGPGPYYGYGPGYDAAAYCMRRFRSYDVRSGTYLGYDGFRHPCP